MGYEKEIVVDNIERAESMLRIINLVGTDLVLPNKTSRPLLTDEECRGRAICHPYPYNYIREIFPDATYFEMMGITPKIL